MDIPERLNFTLLNGYPLYRISIKRDGHCWFHAYCRACDETYITNNFKGDIISRDQLVREMRRAFAFKLKSKVNPLDEDSPIYYDILGNGHLKQIGYENPEFSLAGMISKLDSSQYCGEEIQELVSEELDVDIYYIDVAKKDVYMVSNPDLLYKERRSLIFLYDKEHYDLCAIKDLDGSYITQFKPSHPFIEFLRKKLVRAK